MIIFLSSALSRCKCQTNGKLSESNFELTLIKIKTILIFIIKFGK